MKNLKLYQFSLTAALLVLLSACGGGAEGNQYDTPTVAPFIEESVKATLTAMAPDPAEPSPEISQESTLGPTQEPTVPPPVEGSAYWREIHFSSTGTRLAVPCFWYVDPSNNIIGTAGAFSILANFPSDFYSQQEFYDLVEQGIILKVDLYYSQESGADLSTIAAIEQAVREYYPEEDPEDLYDSTLISAEPVVINGQDFLKATIWNEIFESTSVTYYFSDGGSLLLSFNPISSAVTDHPDVFAILNSIAYQPEAQAQIPDFVPAGPPPGVEAPCMEGAIQ